MPLEVLVVGIHHALADPNPTGFPRDVPPSEPADKKRLEHLLVKMTRDRSASLIAEEQLAPRPSIPRQVAGALGVRYEYVEMSEEERYLRKIPKCYTTDPSLSPQQIQAYHRERELYWIDRVEAAAKPSEGCILVCGRDHLESVTSLLAERKHLVEHLDVAAIPGFDLSWVRSVDKP